MKAGSFIVLMVSMMFMFGRGPEEATYEIDFSEAGGFQRDGKITHATVANVSRCSDRDTTAQHVTLRPSTSLRTGSARNPGLSTGN